MKPVSLTAGGLGFHRHRLVGLWEIMERFDAVNLLNYGRMLEAQRRQLQTELDHRHLETAERVSPLSETALGVDEGLRNTTLAIFGVVGLLCAQLDLERTLGAVYHATRNRKDLPKSLAQLAENIANVQTQLQIDLSERVFLYMPSADAAYFERDAGFGEAVEAAFPSSSFDIREAGNCFAAGRHTASVFHAMCALEPPLKALAKKFKVRHYESAWKTILDQVSSRIAQAQKQPKGPARTKKLDFLSGAAEQFNWIKEAHRNHIAHGRAKYDRGTASSALEHTRGFMQHLARHGLHE